MNIYLIANNDPVSTFDILGLTPPYTYISRGSYGHTNFKFIDPKCKKISFCKWRIEAGSLDFTTEDIDVFDKGIYQVRGSDGKIYTATCDRLAYGMTKTLLHEFEHVDNMKDAVAKANRDTGLPKDFSFKATCNRKLSSILIKWNAVIISALKNERAHGPGAPDPTPHTFYEEYKAGKCTIR